jgi:hypothetical protein
MALSTFKAAVVKPFLPAQFPPNGIRSDVQGFFLPGHGADVTIHQLQRLNKSFDGALDIENIDGAILISRFSVFRKNGQAQTSAWKLADAMCAFLGLTRNEITVM